MRIGVIGDIHGDASALAEVLSVLSEYRIDMLLQAGDVGSDILPPGFHTIDFTNLFPRGYQVARDSLRQMWQSSVLCIERLMSRLGVPVYLVPGNHDLADYPIENKTLVFNCDQRLVGAGNIQLMGVGGSNRTSLSWPYEWSDGEAEKAWNELELREASQPCILLSHPPPYSCLDSLKGKSYLGSSFVQELIRRTSPAICVCGHIHEGFGVKWLDRTLVVNAGSVVTYRHFRRPHGIFVNPIEDVGYQALLLDCSNDLRRITVTTFFISMHNPTMLIVKHKAYTSSDSSTTRPRWLIIPKRRWST